MGVEVAAGACVEPSPLLAWHQQHGAGTIRALAPEKSAWGGEQTCPGSLAPCELPGAPCGSSSVFLRGRISTERAQTCSCSWGLVFPKVSPCSLSMALLLVQRGELLIAELGFCLPLPPLAPLLPKFLPQVPAGRGSQPPESPTALPSVLHLTQGINRWLCPSQPPAPSRMRVGKDFFLKKTTSGHSPGRSQGERS